MEAIMQVTTYVVYTKDGRPMANCHTRKQAEMKLREFEHTDGLNGFMPFSIKMKTIHL